MPAAESSRELFAKGFVFRYTLSKRVARTVTLFRDAPRFWMKEDQINRGPEQAHRAGRAGFLLNRATLLISCARCFCAALFRGHPVTLA
jgi:hypothetical protein